MYFFRWSREPIPGPQAPALLALVFRRWFRPVFFRPSGPRVVRCRNNNLR